MRINRTKFDIIMVRKSINQMKLAQISGISRQTLSAVINGRSCRPELLGRICNALNVDVTELLED